MDGLTNAQEEEICLSELDSSIIKKNRLYCIWISFLFDMHSPSNSLNLCVPLVPHL